jgi:four helix bundle protein
MKAKKDNLILTKTFEFALKVIEYSEELQLKKKFVIGGQILRSGCAVGALVREAQNAESRADFIHRLKVAAKEAEETEYWLELCHLAQSYPKPGILMGDIRSIVVILGKIHFVK